MKTTRDLAILTVALWAFSLPVLAVVAAAFTAASVAMAMSRDEE
jgi:hypothetical protein